MALSIRDWLVQPQPRLGAAGLIILLVASSLITPLSLDMYTPAVPGMAQYFSTDVSMVNMTLVGYYVFFALGMLFFGPLSDKYGRKPVLLAGVGLYTVGSAACAIASSIELLIAFRVIQALGAGSISAVCTAVVKDSFQTYYREKILSVIQVLFVVGPATAPVIGAGVLAVADWRATFLILSIVGVACFGLSLAFKETLFENERSDGNFLQTMKQLVVVGKNPGFMSFLLLTSLFEIPFMGYIAVGSYIYVDFFGVGEVGYSLFFAVAAILMATGPFIWIAASRRVSVIRFTTIMLAFAGVMGIAMMFVGQNSPYAFCACFVAFAMAESCTRPYCMNILLEQQKRDAGSASALMNCIRTGIGAIGMALAALPWTSFVMGIAILIVVFMSIALASWVALLKSRIPLVCVKDEEPVSIL
ncbi:multidrug effflux MFS transporter [Slackia piriformis]|uniref:multidrug effflux MFS transporter n=1 Tax=Slackia piriformis TaxID=626934 RepID=UPI002F945B9F